MFEDFGKQEDLIAWKALSGRITSEEARLMAAKIGQQCSTKYKETRKELGYRLSKKATKESCSLGGKIASKSLVQWQKDNEHVFKERCAELGRQTAKKRMIPHKYENVWYPSKKELQKIHHMCNTTFYRLLDRGVIMRKAAYD